MKRLSAPNDNSLKQQKLFYGILLAIFVVAFNFLWINKTFTLSEGWSFYYCGLLNQGKVAYRDFYYYLPPLNLLVDFLIWKVSAGYFIIYRILRLVERVLIVEIMFGIVSKKVHPFVSFIGSFLSAILASANVYDLGGDYNQTVQLLVVLLCVLVLNYSKNFDNLKKRCFWMFLIGVCGGCMFLSKQTIVFSSALVFAFLIFMLLISKQEKNIFKMIFSVGFGVAVPLGICGLYLVVTHSLTEFITQVFKDTSSKGSALEIVFGSQKDLFKSNLLFVILIIAYFVLVSLIEKKLSQKSKLVNRKYLGLVYIALACLVLTYSYSGSISSAINITKTSVLVAVAFIAFVIIISVLKVDTKWGRLGIVATSIISFVITFLDIKSVTSRIYYESGLFQMLSTLLTFAYIFLIVWLVQHIVKHFVLKTPLAIDTLVLVSGGIASAWSTAMATGMGGVSTISAFITIPAIIYVVFKNKKITDAVYVKTLAILTMLVLSVCTAQKLVCAYSWWGDTEASFSEKTETSNIKALKGFKFSEDEIERVDKLTEVIAANTDENSRIYGFPYIKIYNVLLNNYNMDTFVPVPFYDVCSDAFAKKDAKALAKNEPDIVVWQDIPGCMSLHENLFRKDEPLGQRKIQKWFANVYQTDYELVGQVDNIFVYKLKSDTPATKTYLQRKNRKNTTLKKSDLRTTENTLKGNGTKKSPYKISSANDLLIFAKLVNQGMDFSDKYIEQTADIDLSSVDNWKPVGKYNKKKYFAGNYNGNGYKISNLTIKYDSGINDDGENSDDEYDEIDKSKTFVGLFGYLTGTVRNVYLENCNISGNYVGTIASGASEDSKIYNCFASGEINAKKRAGGIVDNSHGKVVNCVSTVNVISSNPSGISGYYNGAVKNCFSIYGNDISPSDDGYAIDKDTCKNLNDYIDKKSKNATFKLNNWKQKGKELELTIEK